MEVAGHWRREWAGTAEYGKVTEGGVTRQVARAMEVVHASAPGTKLRVMRAAFHSTAGRGAPSASFLMHSSHSVISSGFNLLESPSLPFKPLELSSTPLESSPERNTDTENYKVTEPDDIEISEPSKWRSPNRGSIRMPSEESSSTDNSSIIDLDVKHKNLLRKYSFDSESSDTPTYRKSSARMSTILDEPEALSTLKYKSLLNGSNEWNNRRKSYSFEYTSPASDSLEISNDILAMESSTDSGICKSTELYNESDDRFNGQKYEKQGNFNDWLSNNRLGSYSTSFKKQRDSISVIKEQTPIKVADDYEYKKTSNGDDEFRRAKKVEFCKTELHVVPETGIVNIIATDEKPPPSNDFRKKRSAFVPISGCFDNTVTLFGEHRNSEVNSQFNLIENEINDSEEENIAATKSILKNKIPKPKPYLLGENMKFGNIDANVNNFTKSVYDTPTPNGVSLINKQLHEGRRLSDEISHDNDSNIILGTTSTSPPQSDNLKRKEHIYDDVSQDANYSNSVINKVKNIQISPITTRAKTRQLRESDLTYFGIDKTSKNTKEFKKKYGNENKLMSDSSSVDDLFRSVKLVQRISSSVCSETDSDTPEYQNIPFKTKFAPIPRPRTKYDSNISDVQNNKLLKSVVEKGIQVSPHIEETRRSRTRNHEETIHSNRSRCFSAPPKNRFNDSKSSSPDNQQGSPAIQANVTAKAFSIVKRSNIQARKHEEPTYVNYGLKPKNEKDAAHRIYSNNHKQEITNNKKGNTSNQKEMKAESVTQKIRNFEKQNAEKDNSKEGVNKRIYSDTSDNKPLRKNRTKKLATPEFTYENSKNGSPQSDRIFIKESNDTRNLNSLRNSLRTVANPALTVTKEDQKQAQVHNKDTDVYRISGKAIKSTKELASTRKTSKSHDIQRSSTRTKEKTSNYNGRGNISKPDVCKSPQRSKYIINYDDKNGTVSSVCKVKTDSTITKKKKADKDNLRESSKEVKVKNKPTEKMALLQSADSHWDPYEPIYADRKWKRKMHVQRSCQLL